MSNRKIALTQLMTVATKSKKKNLRNLSQINGVSIMTCTLPRLLGVIDNIYGCHRSYFTRVLVRLCWETVVAVVRCVGRTEGAGTGSLAGSAAQHIPSEATGYRSAGSHGHTSLQQLSSLCRIQALKLETLLSSGLSSLYHDPFCFFKHRAHFWLGSHTISGVLQVVAQRRINIQP